MQNQMEKILTSKYLYLAFFVIAYLGWFLNIAHITVLVLCFFVMLILMFCNDPKGILVVILPVAFFTNGVNSDLEFTFYAVSIGLGLLGIIYFLVKNIFIKKRPFTKGKMFWGFVAITIGCLIGGIAYHFSILPKFSIFGLCFLMYFIYFFCINFTTGLKVFLRRIFISFAIFALIQFLTLHIKSGDFVNSVLSRNIKWLNINFGFGGQHITVCALFFVFAMMCMYWAGFENKKYDYLYCLGGFGFLIATYFTYGRIATFTGGIFTIISIIIIFVKSPNKKIFLISFGVIFAGVALFAIFKWEKFWHLIERYVNMGFSGNGRQVLWPWCIERFKREPFFGIGFLTYGDPVPTVETDTLVLAHNTFLQFLTSTGIIGSLFVGYFYIKKYRVLVNDFKKFDLFTFLISMCIALVGMVDQCVTMDMFIVMTWIVFVALAEISNKEINEKEAQAQEEKNQQEKKAEQKTVVEKEEIAKEKTTNKKET